MTKSLFLGVNYPFKGSTTHNFTDLLRKEKSMMINKIVKICVAHSFYSFETLINWDIDANA